MKTLVHSALRILELCALALTTLLLSAATVLGDEASKHMPISITGTLKVFVSEEPSERLADTEASATVFLFTNGWRYSLDFTAYRRGSGAKAIEIACDGKDIYEVVTFEPLVHQRYLENLPSNVRAGTSGQTARVYPGLVPRTTIPIEIFPWFAFCAKAYIRSLPDQGRMTNIFESSFWPTNEVRSIASFAGPTHAFPQRWQVFKPGFFQISDGGGYSKPFRKNYPAPYDQGFPGAEYEVKSWTTVQGMAFPKEAVLKYKNLEDYGGKWETKTSVSIAWRMDKVEFGTQADLIPRAKTDTQVTDSRLPGRGLMRYFTTTNSPDLKIIPPVDERISQSQGRIRINGK